MAEEYRVHIVDFGRKWLYMRYVDPITGRQVTRSTKTSNLQDATKQAGKWEQELRDGRHAATSKISWDDFRDRYENEVAPSLAANTASKIASVLNTFEEHVKPVRLSVITTAVVSQYAAKLREMKRAETTINSHLAHLKAAFNWAHKQGLLAKVPVFTMPKRINVARHRPITGEEFERMLEVTPQIVGEGDVESWRFLLRGLWLSGLRIGEAVKLSWDRDDLPMVVQTGKGRMMLSIPAAHQKSHEDTLLPIAPEFGELLMTVPAEKRKGPVFNPQAHGHRADLTGFKATISKIGRAAKVKAGNSRDGGAQFATAHDLRRSFGDRWSKLVMPAILRKMMRHKTIQTTMSFYVGSDANDMADVIDAAFRKSAGNYFGNTGTKAESKPPRKATRKKAAKPDDKSA